MNICITDSIDFLDFVKLFSFPRSGIIISLDNKELIVDLEADKHSPVNKPSSREFLSSFHLGVLHLLQLLQGLSISFLFFQACFFFIP